jgi:phage RecT family recombinase
MTLVITVTSAFRSKQRPQVITNFQTLLEGNMTSTALTIHDRVFAVEKEFNQVNDYKLNFIKEAQFALQLLDSNDYLFKAAQANPAALEYALINLASIGISLNPALKEAYLVPRGGKICLDIPYIGLIKLATDTGSVLWVQAQVVKKNDVFKFLGVGKAPVHEMDPFGNRGEVIGVYCVAKLSTGESLSTVMSKAECDDIKDKSSQASKSGPWVTFYEEMLKKTVIKRASKLWPKSKRLDTAVQVLNEHEGIDFSSYAKGAFSNAPSDEAMSEDAHVKVEKLLKDNNFTHDRLLNYINKKFNCNPLLTSIAQLNPTQIEESIRIIGSQI